MTRTNPEEAMFVKILSDKLDFSRNRDFFFLSDQLLAVPLSEAAFSYAIIRTKDGTILCTFCNPSVQFVFNTTTFWWYRAPDAIP